MVDDPDEHCQKVFNAWMVLGRTLMAMVNLTDYILAIVGINLVGIWNTSQVETVNIPQVEIMNALLVETGGTSQVAIGLVLVAAMATFSLVVGSF